MPQRLVQRLFALLLGRVAFWASAVFLIAAGCRSTGVGSFGPGEYDPVAGREHKTEYTTAYDVRGMSGLRVSAPAGTVLLGRSRDRQVHVTARLAGFGVTPEAARRSAYSLIVGDEVNDQGILVLSARPPGEIAVTSVERDRRGNPYFNGLRVPRGDFVIAVPDGLPVEVRTALALESRGLRSDLRASALEDVRVMDHNGNLALSCEAGPVRMERVSGDISATGLGTVEARECSGAKVLRSNSGRARIIGGEGKVEVRASGDILVISHLWPGESHHLRSDEGGVDLRVSPESSLQVHAFSGDGGISLAPDLPLSRAHGIPDPGDDRPVTTVDLVLGDGEGPVDIRARGRVSIAVYQPCEAPAKAAPE